MRPHLNQVNALNKILKRVFMNYKIYLTMFIILLALVKIQFKI